MSLNAIATPALDQTYLDFQIILGKAAARRSIREHGGEPSSRDVDELLDERLAHCSRPGEDAAVDSSRRVGFRA
jgi:hypothetical protein